MTLLQYLKERWLTYTFALAGLGFSTIVYRLDQSFNITTSNANYILLGWLFLFLLFIALDYGIFYYRMEVFKKYCSLNTSFKDLDDFIYPMDKEYARLVYNLVLKFEKYKSKISTKSSEELEFITKWVHDVKVPLSALRLILETQENNLPNHLYQDMDKELFSIEESIQRVFYQIKANSLHDDYKIAKVSTKQLIALNLKGYANFFSYKKLNLSFSGEEYQVLTDEKWSGYILSQIISNAVKHTPVGGIIDISTRKNENQITISITNSGKGIAINDIAQIFDKGFTSSEDRNSMKATGYGLYLAKNLSDMLGHKLTAQSKYDEYATFSLIFIENQTLHQM